MVDSLQQRIERERRFFGDVSHELRTRLTTLVTAVGVLNRYQDALPNRADEAFNLVKTEVKHLHRLLEHLLALARAEAGLHQDEPETLSLGELLLNVLTDSGRAADLLTVGEDSVVCGRKLALERTFVNLIDNAERHGGGATAGTGLGLALVAETVAGHGGDVRCTDRPGGGARMVVTLPAVAPCNTSSDRHP